VPWARSAASRGSAWAGESGSDAGQVLLHCGYETFNTGVYTGGNTGGNLLIWSSAAGSQLVQGYPAGENGFSWLSNGWVATLSSDGAIVSFFRLSDLTK